MNDKLGNLLDIYGFNFIIQNQKSSRCGGMVLYVKLGFYVRVLLSVLYNHPPLPMDQLGESGVVAEVMASNFSSVGA